MSAVLEYIVCALLLGGAAFALVGSWGLARLSDFFLRLHGPTKASTLGVGGVLLASMLWQAMQGAPSLRELLITLFLFMTAPVSAHLLAKAALALDPKARPAIPEPSPQASAE
jgi:multicomponent K+:H+ antiporter subunit G